MYQESETEVLEKDQVAAHLLGILMTPVLRNAFAETAGESTPTRIVYLHAMYRPTPLCTTTVITRAATGTERRCLRKKPRTDG